MQVLAGAAGIVVVLLSACISAQQRAGDAIFDAWRNNEAMPLAHVIDETLTIDAAYREQTRIVRRALARASDDRGPAGFKAGLISLPSQARFKAAGPVAGVLLPGGLHTASATLHLSELRGLNIETEVAFRIGRRIDSRIADIAALRGHIDGIAPAIELPDLDYQTPDRLNAIDIVASNVAASGWMLGEFVSPERRDANAVAPRLVCDGKVVNTGQARDALGDQWQAALWLVNTMIDQGWTLEPGQILLTGALGRMVPAQPGRCIADFGTWGSIEVVIAP